MRTSSLPSSSVRPSHGVAADRPAARRCAGGAGATGMVRRRASASPTLDRLDAHDRARRVAVVEQRRRAGEALSPISSSSDHGAVDAVQRVALAGDVADASVVRHRRSPPVGVIAVGAATIVPVASPKPIARRRSSPPHQPRSVTVSPSSRNVRVVPSGSVSGSAPRHVSSIRLPRSAGVGPLTVPDPNRSPAPVVAPLTVMWASCWANVQYMSREVRRRDLRAVELDRRGRGRAPTAARRAGTGRARGPARAARRGTGRSASSVTTHGEIVVAKLLPRYGPSGWYSKAWMSRADQSLSSTTPKTWRSASSGAMRAVGRAADDEADLELDVERARSARGAARRRPDRARGPRAARPACR